MLKRLTTNSFLQSEATVGVEFHSFLLRVEDRLIKLHIWDSAGQEYFRSVTKVFYRQTHAVLLCFPINNRDSFNNL